MFMPSKIDVSIILVNYNGGEQVMECLHSLEADGYEGREIIVVDNASLDGSPACIKSTFPNVKLFQSATNLGYGGGNNLGANYAQGFYIAFLNPDILVQPGWLEALSRVLDADPGVAMATARILLQDRPDTINACGNDVHISGLTLCRGMGQPRQAFDTPSEVAAVSGAAFMIRRELFNQLGGFDARYFLYMEDTDLSLRARLAGWRILYVPEALVYHNYQLGFESRKIYYQERNRYLTLLKIYHFRTLLALLPTLLLAEVVTWGFVLSYEPKCLINKLNAYVAILRDWSPLIQARGRAQSTRKITDRTLLEICATLLSFEQTGETLAASLAHQIFDPLFHVCHKFILKVVHW
jgi:GT2 family glycosyltransferase